MTNPAHSTRIRVIGLRMPVGIAFLVLALFGIACGPGPRATTDASVDAPPVPALGELRDGFHLPGLLGERDRITVDLAAGPDGLVVGGWFRQAGTVRSRPARWASSWHAMPSTDATQLAVDRDGVIYAGSRYIGCDLCSPSPLRRLNNQSWVEIDGPTGTFEELLATPAGILAVGDLWNNVGPASVVRYGSAGPVVLGTARLAGFNARTLAVAESAGTICVGGAFDAMDGRPARNVACLGPSGWAEAGAGLPGEVRALAFTSDGRLIAGGAFVLPDGGHLAVLQGGTWSALGGGVDGAGAIVNAIAIDGDAILVGGTFSSPAENLARFENGTWSSPAGGVHASDEATSVTSVVVTPEGVYVGGRFDLAGGIATSHVALWTASGVKALLAPGDQPLGVSGEVRTAVMFNAQLVAAGQFRAAGIAAVNHVAVFDGARWTPLGDPGQAIRVLAVRTDGSLIAGGDGGKVQRWTNSAWEQIGITFDASVNAIIEHEGELVVAGDFTTASNHVARWTGTTFETMGQGLDAPVRTLGHDGAGRLCAGLDHRGRAQDTRAFHPLWCWDGAAWRAVADLSGEKVSAIAVLAAGSTLVAGNLYAYESESAALLTSSWNAVRVAGGRYYAEDSPTCIAAGDGAVLAVSDQIHLWDAEMKTTKLFEGAWTRTLLATPTGFVAGGNGLFRTDDTVSAGIAVWDYFR